MFVLKAAFSCNRVKFNILRPYKHKLRTHENPFRILHIHSILVKVNIINVTSWYLIHGNKTMNSIFAQIQFACVALNGLNHVENILGSSVIGCFASCGCKLLLETLKVFHHETTHIKKQYKK